MKGWKEERMKGGKDERRKGWTDEWKDERKKEWMNNLPGWSWGGCNTRDKGPFTPHSQSIQILDHSLVYQWNIQRWKNVNDKAVVDFSSDSICYNKIMSD